MREPGFPGLEARATTTTVDQANTIPAPTAPCECDADGTPLSRGLSLLGMALRTLEAGSAREREEGLAIACGAIARRYASELDVAA